MPDRFTARQKQQALARELGFRRKDEGVPMPGRVRPTAKKRVLMRERPIVPGLGNDRRVLVAIDDHINILTEVADRGGPSVVPDAHLDWMASRPFYHTDRHRLFVHAGVQPSVPLDEQTEHTLQWMIWPAGSDGDYRGLHIVHGHEQFADGPKCFAGRTDLDTFAWYTGRLVVGVFDDSKPGGPVGFLEVKASPHV